MPNGQKFETYLQEFVPALLTAGGKTVEEIVARGAWDCHSWTNCPMAVAFGITDQTDLPLRYKTQAEEFILLFDAGLIPVPNTN